MKLSSIFCAIGLVASVLLVVFYDEIHDFLFFRYGFVAVKYEMVVDGQWKHVITIQDIEPENIMSQNFRQIDYFVDKSFYDKVQKDYFITVPRSAKLNLEYLRH